MRQVLERVRNPKFKVFPGLSLKGKDIMIRLKNKSLVLDSNGQYIIDHAIDDTRRMSKIEIARKAMDNQQDIADLRVKIGKQNAKKPILPKPAKPIEDAE